MCIRTVHGSVTDLAAKPLGGLIVSVCGTTCYFGKTLDDGSFITSVGHYIDVTKFAVLVHARPNYANLYVALPTPRAGASIDAPGADLAIEPVRLPNLPSKGPDLVAADGFAPAAPTVSAGDVTLHLASGTSVELDIEDFDTTNKAGHQFRIAKVAPADFPPFAKTSKATVFYAMAPFDAKFTDGKTAASPIKVGVTLTNPDPVAFPAGTPIELLVMGNELLKSPFTGGALLVGATASVSSDGLKIDTNPGEGIVSLTWLGVRKK
ncbi:MAG: hypothetical protein NVS3B20_20570 [Polyangiales bacterium]